MRHQTFEGQQALALATSQIHRSRTLKELQRSFLHVAPKFVNANAYGLYLFDDKMEIQTVISHRANRRFLLEYEKIRAEDPLFRLVRQKKTFTHSLDLFDQSEWLKQPLHKFLSRWGLDYSIEAPLVHDGQVSGTLNFAIGGNRYFDRESLAAARFLCSEFDSTYKRILELEKLEKEVRRLTVRADSTQDLSARSRQILEMLLGGLNNGAISGHLNISENTVRYHIKQIYRAFGVHNRVQLVRYIYTGPASRN